MFENLTNFSKLLRNASSMVPKIQQIKDRLSDQRVEGKSDRGDVVVEMSGAGTILTIKIDPSLIAAQDKSLLELTIAAATNEAILKAKNLHVHAVREAVKDLGIPGIDNVIAQLAE
jgi:DNA-binding YbaB/EbfC family protein